MVEQQYEADSGKGEGQFFLLLLKVKAIIQMSSFDLRYQEDSSEHIYENPYYHIGDNGN